MDEHSDDNPFAAPGEDERHGRRPDPVAPPVLVQGWVVVLLGLIALAAGLSVAFDELRFGGQAGTVNAVVNALFYGVPAAIAAFVIGARNIKHGAYTAGSRVGMVISVAAFVIPLLSLMVADP